MEEGSIEAIVHSKYHELLVQMYENSRKNDFKLVLLSYLVKCGGSILKVYPWLVSLYSNVVIMYYLLPRIEDVEIKNIISKEIQNEEQMITQKVKQ